MICAERGITCCSKRPQYVAMATTSPSCERMGDEAWEDAPVFTALACSVPVVSGDVYDCNARGMRIGSHSPSVRLPDS